MESKDTKESAGLGLQHWLQAISREVLSLVSVLELQFEL